MTTFSQIVDSLIAESRRPDLKADIVTYVNQTIRELHLKDDSSTILYSDNLIELLLTPTDGNIVDNRFVWDIPAPQGFQHVEAVYYPLVGEYARKRKPSSIFLHEDDPYVWYRTGPALAFSGFGGSGAEILLAYFQFPRRLTYFSTATRPAVWNEANESFAYLPAYDIDPTTRANARNQSTNWILDRWEDVVMQGTRAKLYAKLADDVRMRQAYSAFEKWKASMIAAETYDSAPLFAR